MVDRTITSADASFVVSSSDFALAATILEGYGADAAFTADNQDTAELVLGVDGKMSAGWVPRMYPQVITLQADSPSLIVFEGIVAAQDAGRTVFRLNGVINLPGNKFSYTMNRGVLSSTSPMANAQRVLQARTFTITWESIVPVPIG